MPGQVAKALRRLVWVALAGSAPSYVQSADRLASTDGVRNGQTLLCRYELSAGNAKDQEYALSCRQSPATDDEFGLECFLDVPASGERPAFVCPVTAPLPFVAGAGLHLDCKGTPEELRGRMRRSLAALGRPLSTPIPTLSCTAAKFDIPWEAVHGVR